MQIKNGEILGLTNQDTYHRGKQWYDSGRVRLLETDEDFFSARVHDFPAHSVSIHRSDNQFVTSCTCLHPSACEHVVAALLKARDYYSSPAYLRKLEKNQTAMARPNRRRKTKAGAA